MNSSIWIIFYLFSHSFFFVFGSVQNKNKKKVVHTELLLWRHRSCGQRSQDEKEQKKTVSVLSCRRLSPTFLIFSSSYLIEIFFMLIWTRGICCWYHQFIGEHKFLLLIKLDKSFGYRRIFMSSTFFFLLHPFFHLFSQFNLTWLSTQESF